MKLGTGTASLKTPFPTGLIVILLFALAVACAPANALTPLPTPAHHGLFAVKVTGTGPAIILIPGLSSSGDTWTGTVDHLSPHYQCHVLTLAGFAGQTPWADIDKGGFLHAVEDELAAYIRDNKLESPTIIGHSLGGTLALEFAERYPDLPGKLVIVDSFPFLGAVWLQVASVEDAAPAASKMKQQMEAETPAQYQAFVKSGASTRYMVTSDANFAKITEWGLASDQSTVAEAVNGLLTTDARPGLAKIRGDVLVLATWAGFPGETSEHMESVHRAQYSGTAKLHLVMAGKERHFIMLDNPPWFYAQVDSFLSSPPSVPISPLR